MEGKSQLFLPSLYYIRLKQYFIPQYPNLYPERTYLGLTASSAFVTHLDIPYLSISYMQK